MEYVDLEKALKGKTLTECYLVGEPDPWEVNFITTDGDHIALFHEQDCCESVVVEEVHGDLNDLVGAPLEHVAETSEVATGPEILESGTWTFYNFRTIKGSVTIRWLGESNGYYGESVTAVRRST